MTNTTPTGPEPPGPSPGRRPARRARRRAVCFGCVVVALCVLVGHAILGRFRRAARLGDYTILSEVVIGSLPDGVDRAESEEVQRGLLKKVRNGSFFGRSDLAGRWQEVVDLYADAEADGRLDGDEALEIYDIMRQLAGVEAPRTPAELQPNRPTPTEPGDVRATAK